MKRITSSLFLLCLAQALLAQNVYYPLTVGDRWQLSQIVSTNPVIIAYIDLKVVSDTTMPNGQTYARIDGWAPSFQRQLGNQVLVYSGTDTTEHVMYDFSRSVGDTVGTYHSASDTFDVILVDSVLSTLFGQSRRTFSYWHKAHHLIDVDTYQTIVDSVGLIHSDGFVGPYDLVGAVISGQTYGTIVSAPIQEPIRPEAFRLYQNFPNPFNSQTTITFELNERSLASLKIYNILGQELNILNDQVLDAGIHHFQFDAGTLPSGAYIYTLSARGFTLSRMMILAK